MRYLFTSAIVLMLGVVLLLYLSGNGAQPSSSQARPVEAQPRSSESLFAPSVEPTERVAQAVNVAATPQEPAPTPQPPSAATAESRPMAFIWGTVRAPDQEFLEYVGVTLHEVIPANSHYTAKRQDFRVDQYGRFEGSVPAGEYLVKCDRDRSLREELKHRLEPKIVGITEYWTLPADSSTELNFDLLPGGTTLRLVLVDQNGAVMSEMKTSLWPTDVKDGSTGARRPSGGMTATVGNRTSDKDGICLFEGLRPGRYGIAVEPEGYLPTAKPGQSKLGQRFDPIEYDLSLGTREVRLQLVRAKPVRIWGQVSQEKRDKHVSPARPLMTLILPANEKRSKDRRSEVHIQADGSFEFYVDASEHYAMLELTAGESTVTVPVAWTDFDEELLLPIAFP